MPAPPFAVVSDLHANLEATRAVWADLERQSIERIVCLGDIIGYGPDPGPVIDFVRRHATGAVGGNHDWAVLHEPFGFNPAARGAVEYTRDLLRPHNGRSSALVRARWRFLQDLPIRLEEEEFSFVHGSLRDPLTDYCFGDRQARWNPGQVDEIMEQVRWICFAGHTHWPVVIRDDKVCWYPRDEDAALELRHKRRYIVNAGSVGQPRDGDPRACYAVFDGEAVHYHRVPYDAAKTARKIHRIRAIEDFLGERLLVGR